jgi:hypothetical protein
MFEAVTLCVCLLKMSGEECTTFIDCVEVLRVMSVKKIC